MSSLRVVSVYLVFGLIFFLFHKHFKRKDAIERVLRMTESNRWRAISLCPEGCLATWDEEASRPKPYVVLCPRCKTCPPEIRQQGNSGDARCTVCGFVDNIGRFISSIPNWTLGVWAERPV